MISLIWSPQPIRDLESIRQYISRDSPHYSDLVVRHILTAAERLTMFPESGRIVPEIGRRSVREVVVPPYRVVYRLRRESVEIVTVFHAVRLFRVVRE